MIVQGISLTEILVVQTQPLVALESADGALIRTITVAEALELAAEVGMVVGIGSRTRIKRIRFHSDEARLQLRGRLEHLVRGVKSPTRTWFLQNVEGGALYQHRHDVCSAWRKPLPPPSQKSAQSVSS